MDAVTFVIAVAVHSVSLRTLQAAAAVLWTVIARRSSQPRAGYATGQLLKLSPRMCREFLAARGGRSWTPVEDCVAGKSTVISAKTNRWGQANYKAGHVRRLLNTLTPTREF